MHEGHRLRMYEKLKNNPNVLAEHEWLEMLLFNARLRGNTNPLAHNLLDEFGSVQRMFAASVEELMQVEGVGLQTACYLKCIGVFLEKYTESKEPALPKKYDVNSFSGYLKQYFSGRTYEIFNIYVLDERNNILFHKKFTDKDECSVSVPPQEVTKLAGRYGGKFFVLAHNHVRGGRRPSQADDELTKQCEIICSINNVRLLDHFIYAEGELFSYYQSGKMASIAHNYHIKRVLERDVHGER